MACANCTVSKKERNTGTIDTAPNRTHTSKRHYFAPLLKSHHPLLPSVTEQRNWPTFIRSLPSSTNVIFVYASNTKLRDNRDRGLASPPPYPLTMEPLMLLICPRGNAQCSANQRSSFRDGRSVRIKTTNRETSRLMAPERLQPQTRKICDI